MVTGAAVQVIHVNKFVSCYINSSSSTCVEAVLVGD